MKLVVGLGNVGKEYDNTRHNIGFKILDNYLENVNWKEKKHYLYFQNVINGNDVIYIKPTTFMNLSGIAVKEIVNFYKIDYEDILVIQDDLDLDIGKFKVKRNSSSGGHNGIKSIINELNTDKFYRLKIGIGKSETIPADKYVLSKISEEENNALFNNINKYKNIISTFINSGGEEALRISKI